MLALLSVLFCFALCTLSSGASASPSVISVDNPAWYWTEHNWFFDITGRTVYAQTNNPGAYFKIGFTGTTAKLAIDWTGGSSAPFATIRWSIDDLPFTDTVLPLSSTVHTDSELHTTFAAQRYFNKTGGFAPPQYLPQQLDTTERELTSPTSGILTLGTGLTPGSHTLVFYFRNSLQSLDRWVQPNCFVRITSLLLDFAASVYPLPLLPRRILAYWDSIGEGVGIVSNGHGDLVDNDATGTWAFTLAFALEAEISVIGYGRQGYNISGNGNVPPLITPGDRVNTAWDKFDSQHSRLDVDGLLYNVQPDYIVCGHGTNDGLSGVDDEYVVLNTFAWLQSIRSAAPSASLLVAIPFGAYKSSPISLAFAQYQSLTHDTSAYLISTGIFGAKGVVGAGHPTAEAGDGLHPRGWRSAQLGAMLANGVVRAVNGEGRSDLGAVQELEKMRWGGGKLKLVQS